VSKWQVADACAFEGNIGYQRGSLLIGDSRVPMADMSVLLAGPKVSLTPGALQAAARFDVMIVHVDWRHQPVLLTMPFATHSHIATRQQAQASMTLPRRKNAWMRIVKAKIRGQANALTANQSHGADHLRELATRVRSGDPNNIEAQAARVYWSTLFSGRDFSRKPRGHFGINALLDYGYAILRTHTIRAICAAGLTPALGISHVTRNNAFVLADDLMEPFRPAIDNVVVRLSEQAKLSDPEVKSVLVGAMRKPQSPNGVTTATAVHHLAVNLACYAVGDVDRLVVPTWTANG
jgi:CRISPR-associated protein Cas1